jgi:hypothetical protein
VPADARSVDKGVEGADQATQLVDELVAASACHAVPHLLTAASRSS